jgi:aryl-alcohol dehydrogenase-like predicted oxidoreductase
VFYTQLGRSALRVSRIGFGCWPMGGHGWGRVDDASSVRAVRAALDAGVTLFDTADVYGLGHSETTLAAALGSDRHTVVIATKFGVRWDAGGTTWRDLSDGWLDEALHGSLRRLQIDAIPVYQIHWDDGVTPIERVMERLCRYQEAGKILAIGACNGSPSDVARLAETGPLASMQVAYNALDRKAEEGVFPAVHARGGAILTHSSLAQGLCSGKRTPGARFGADDIRSRSRYFQDVSTETGATVARLREIGARHGCSPAQAALGWVLAATPVASALVGMKTPEQVRENVRPLWNMTDADRDYIAHGDLEPAETPALTSRTL